jgi:hypothetical protein
VRIKAEIAYGLISKTAADNIRTGKIWSVGFSADGRFIAWGKKRRRANINGIVSLDQSFQLYNERGEASLALGAPLKDGMDYLRAIKQVGNISIRLRGPTLQVKQGTGKYKFAGSSDKIPNVWSCTLTPDGKTIIYAGQLGGISALSADNNQFLCDFVGHTGDVRGLAVSPDGRFLVSGAEDQTVKLWPLSDLKQKIRPILSIYHGLENDWIAWTPDGYYVSSVNGDKYIGWHINRGKDKAAEYYSAFQFERILYRPDIVHARLGGSQLSEDNIFQYGQVGFDIKNLRSIAPPRILITSPAYGQTVSSATDAVLNFSVSQNSIDMRNYSVFVNNIPVVQSEQRTLTGGEQKKFSRRLKIPLFDKENKVRVEVFNGKAMGIANTLIYLGGGISGDSAGDLYLLSVGINTFEKMPSYNLRYAARDAEAVAQVFGAMEGKAFKRVFIKTISDHSALKPTRDNILQALAFIKSSTASDTVIVFLASHGFSDSAGNYYFMPADASFKDMHSMGGSANTRGVLISPQNMPSFIRWEAFFDALRSVAGQRLLVVDTCQAKRISGTLDIHSLAKRSASSSFALLVASRGNEYSQEYDQGKHGLFTYGLIEGLSDKGDENGDGQVTLMELYNYVFNFVERKRDKTIGPQTPQLVAPHELKKMTVGRS